MHTFSAGYAVPLALAAAAADATIRHQGITPEIARDDGARWFFQGVGTYRAIKRRAAAMRTAMHPEESAALLVERGERPTDPADPGSPRDKPVAENRYASADYAPKATWGAR